MANLGTDRARPQAYEFAHRAVLAVARKNPARFHELAASGRLVPVLTALWQGIGERFPADERIPAEGMRTSVYQADGRSVVIVRPPLAEHITEAHFIAVAIRGGRFDRYFVLEHGWKVDDTPWTMMGEWTRAPHMKWARASHRNWCEGPPPDDEDRFLQAVLCRLAPIG